MKSARVMWWGRMGEARMHSEFESHRIPFRPKICGWFPNHDDELDICEGQFWGTATFRAGDAGKAVDVALRAGAERVEVRPSEDEV